MNHTHHAEYMFFTALGSLGEITAAMVGTIQSVTDMSTLVSALSGMRNYGNMNFVQQATPHSGDHHHTN